MSDDERNLPTVGSPNRTVGVTSLHDDMEHVTAIRLSYLKQALDVLDALGHSDRTYLNIHTLPGEGGKDVPLAVVLQPEDHDNTAVIAPKKEVSDS